MITKGGSVHFEKTPSSMKNSERNYVELLVAALSIVTVIILFAVFFSQIPTQHNTLAMDWKTEWAAIRQGNLQYLSVDGIRFPPWSMVPLLPLGFLPMQAAWGILAGMGVMILVASVPETRPKPLYWVSVLLVVISFPTVRNIVDGNMENIVVAGVLLILMGYSSERVPILVIGLLLATIKLQEVTLLLVVLVIYVLRSWKPSTMLKAGLSITALIGLSLLWRGKGWFEAVFGLNYQKYTNSIIDISLTGALSRIGITSPIVSTSLWIAIAVCSVLVAWKSRMLLTREKAGMLIAASLLTAPYAAGNSVLSVLAIGLIPYFQSHRLLGGFFILLVNLPYLWSVGTLYAYQSIFWSALVFLFWIVLARRCLAMARASDRPQGADEHQVQEA
jgi:hypothetical protein